MEDLASALEPLDVRRENILVKVPDSNICSIKMKVRLDIYNTQGQKIKTLIQGMQKAGYYNVKWNGTDNTGNSVGAGYYIYRLYVGKKVLADDMVLMR